MLTAPALAQTPPAPRDPLRDEMAAIVQTCFRAYPATLATITSVPPARYEEAAGICEAALVDLDATFARVPAPTDRQRSDHARMAFTLLDAVGRYYSSADLRRGAGPADIWATSQRACQAFERALEAYGRIDPDRRDVPGRVSSLSFSARTLDRCRDQYGAPDGAAPVPDVAPPASPRPPPPGTLGGDFVAVVGPCLSVAMNRDVPLAERTAICERASEAVPTVMAIYPDTSDVERMTVAAQLAQLYTNLAGLQYNMDGRATPRACASLEKAVAADAFFEARARFRHPLYPIIDAMRQTSLAPCGVVRPSR